MDGAMKPLWLPAWKRDKVWSDRFGSYVRGLLGQQFFKPAADWQDQREATDFDFVLTMSRITVACRLRTIGYLARFPYDVTVRATRPSGTPTELDKILAGFASHMLYGFGDDTGDRPRIPRWIILSMDAFRLAYPELTSVKQANSDGSSDFLAFDARELADANCIYAHSTGYFNVAEQLKFAMDGERARP